MARPEGPRLERHTQLHSPASDTPSVLVSGHVIVVGAGIAGLVAAYRLQQAGVRVTVLEASLRVGGRMTTDVVDGCVIDRGAQFLSSGYRTLLPLIREVGLGEGLREVRGDGAILRDGTPRRVRRDRPLSPITSGLVPLTDMFRLAWAGQGVVRSLWKLPLDDYAAWARFDNRDAADWFRERGVREAVEYLLEPALEGFYFQAPEGTSLALALLLLAFNARRERILTLCDGLGLLPDAIGRQLEVQLGVPVRRVERHADGVRVISGSGVSEADHVVLAIPASAARSVLRDIREFERPLLSTDYSATVLVSLAVDRGWRVPAALERTYGLLIPRSERGTIAAIGIESKKHEDRVATGELLNLMLSGGAGAELVAADEATILARVLPDAERLLPGISRAIRFAHVVRWPEAEPRSPVGRARAVAAYRHLWAQTDRRVVLAGDYTGAPFADGAAETGQWAARSLAEALLPMGLHRRL